MDLSGGGGGGISGAAVAPAQQQQQQTSRSQPSETMKLTSRNKSQSSSQSSINSENLYTKNLTFMQLFKRSILKNVLLVSTIAAVFFGTVIGLILRNATGGQASPDTVQLLAFPGDMFLRMLKMLILPLIIASVISALASLDSTVSGKIGMRACLLYLTTTVVATITGIILVTLIHPGDVRMKEGFHGPKGEFRSRASWNGFRSFMETVDVSMREDKATRAGVRAYNLRTVQGARKAPLEDVGGANGDDEGEALSESRAWAADRE